MIRLEIVASTSDAALEHSLDVELVPRDAEFLLALDDGSCECLMQLKQVDIHRSQFLSAQQFAGGRDAA